jgi:hypothetical protein
LICFARYRAYAAVIVFCVFAILICGCATPLAPGYKIQKETLSVHFVPGNPPHLAILAEYTLANIGNAPLHFVGVSFPGEKEFGRADLHAEIDSKEITLQHNVHEVADDWRIPFAAPWQQKQKINLTLAYDLATEAPTDPRISVAPNTFYLNDSGWFPGLMGFKAFLSPSVTRPDPAELSVTVPAGFRVTASGTPRGEKKQSGETQYHFRIRKGDFDPYVLAGRFSEQRVSPNAMLWSPQAAFNLRQKSDALAGTFPFYTHLFGPLPRDNTTVYIVDASGSSASSDSETIPDSLPTVVFANGSLGGERPTTSPSPGDDKNLANTWFSHLISPRPEAWLLADGLIAYAAELAGQQSPNRTPRGTQISSVLANFDQSVKEAVEKPMISLTLTDSAAQRRIGQSKIVLFLFALEDQCGPQNVTHAMHDMVYALRGEQYGYSDFRASLEQQCHQDLGGFFRTWLTKPGIPPDFRARYQNAGADNNKP